MDAAKLQALLDEVRALSAALRQGEIARANELLLACKVPELAASGAIPPGPEGAPLRAAIDEALGLAVELQAKRRSALAQGGTSRRALRAYASRGRR